jgi:nucleotide-binding universal stress UspA family protein
MFRHVLIPVDGSPLATRAAKAGVAFARRSGAKLTVYHAINPLPYGFYATGADPGDRISVQLERRARAQGEKHVAVIVRAARAAGVPCQSGWKWLCPTKESSPARGGAAATASSSARTATAA